MQGDQDERPIQGELVTDLDANLDSPVVVIGMARSGTTILFEGIAAHPDLGWINHHFERFPRHPNLAGLARLCDWSFAFRKSMRATGSSRSPFERFRDGPSEGYPVWNHYGTADFASDFLLGRDATPSERGSLRSMLSNLLLSQHKTRLTFKLTGPARIQYVRSVFPNARFVHVVRDGRAVATSLMRAGFWRDTFRAGEPAWSGSDDAEMLEQWERSGRAPLVLAALQWQHVVNLAIEERERCGVEWLQLRYPDFLADPTGSLGRIFEFASLPASDRPMSFLTERAQLLPSDTDFRERLSEAEWRQLMELLAPTLERLGFSL